MTDSAIDTLAFSDETDAVVVPAFISENETTEIQNMVQVRTVQVNDELESIGQSMVACAGRMVVSLRGIPCPHITSLFSCA
jgi:hypothetical protein